MVNLQPFAFRKVIVLIAALLWLTSAVLFADPVFMNTRAAGLAHHASELRLQSASHSPRLNRCAELHGLVEQSDITPAEGPAVFSVSFERLDTWHVAPRTAADCTDLRYWPTSLPR